MPLVLVDVLGALIAGALIALSLAIRSAPPLVVVSTAAPSSSPASPRRGAESTVLRHPDVSLVAVVGVPHRSHGEEVKAFVIRRPGSPLTEDELVKWCRERLASYKYPRLFEFRDELPMTSTGKILKRRLCDRA
ncbi:hypothetical protein AB0E12_25980 [Micromonospora chersina]|uniref:AMP-binding enzyme n=1 Tax=Micromonospora chersina TaxID=47854 RepID=UPI0033CC12A4